jgi:hypothetical protein
LAALQSLRHVASTHKVPEGQVSPVPQLDTASVTHAAPAAVSRQWAFFAAQSTSFTHRTAQRLKMQMSLSSLQSLL